MNENKKKLLLISPSYKITHSSKATLRFDPPIGLLNLASFLAENGYQCDIVNTAFENIDYNKIKNGEYGLVGFTIFIGEFLKNARQISVKIKNIDPTIGICYGGVMASLFPEKILEEYPVDYIVCYEGEYTLLELLGYLEGTTDINAINGLSYKVGEKIVSNPPRLLENKLDKFPVPKWELLGQNCNRNQNPYYFRIMSSKGCPFNCSFCYKHSVDEEIRTKSPIWRYRSAVHVLAEMDQLNRINGTIVFTFGDDNFFVKINRAIEIISLMKQRGYYIEQCIGHLNNFNDEVINTMGGTVQTVIYSIESASPRLLKLLNKHIKTDAIPNVNRKLVDKGITTTHNFMVGLPTETDEDLKTNVELMILLKSINPYVRALTYVFLPLPCTPLSNYVEDQMGCNLPNMMNDYEKANFDSGKEDGLRYRPWLTKERYELLHKYCSIFDDVFQINNLSLSEESLSYLNDDLKLKHIFRGIDGVNRPKKVYRPYILDRVLEGDNIDLLSDLKKNIYIKNDFTEDRNMTNRTTYFEKQAVERSFKG